ncbi:MAG TPA: TraR/DksA family transcriptional regulator [Ramlibacter sp.]|jgi:RNA polymerase-binding transcription factor DksA|uniref:TraR/DksA family transcriptional regulator n=1 Tax=Ramlibacter sp. TaxID=1917967 RepID=UPI002D2CB46C|nr:TraR/DksA family transcriptional regulator [Ramlibacter sp.]HZY19015.1 TraR/DksA family transcriptional regulator [Ramlibacter sp.]
MNESQRSELDQLLQQREADLRAGVRGLREDIAAPAGDTGPEVRDGPEDGDARMMTTLDVTQLRRQDSELREVIEARERMQRGEYGRCEECDEPIPFERLKARPEARFCIRHEEAWEKAHPQVGALPT